MCVPICVNEYITTYTIIGLYSFPVFIQVASRSMGWTGSYLIAVIKGSNSAENKIFILCSVVCCVDSSLC